MATSAWRPLSSRGAHSSGLSTPREARKCLSTFVLLGFTVFLAEWLAPARKPAPGVLDLPSPTSRAMRSGPSRVYARLPPSRSVGGQKEGREFPRGRGRFVRGQRRGNSYNGQHTSNPVNGRRMLSELPKKDLLKIHTAQIYKAGKEGLWEHALRAYTWLRSWKVQPDRFAYNALITALSASCPSRAVGFYEEMIEQAVTPDAVTYRGVIAAEGNRGNWQRSLSLFREFLEKGTPESDPLGAFQGVRKTSDDFTASPLEVLYNTLITACGLSKQWTIALSLFKEMEESSVGVTIVSYGALLIAYEKSARDTDAIDVLRQMEKKEVIPNCIHYNTIIFSCANAKNWQMGYELFNEMKAKSIELDVISYLAVIQAASEGSKWELALSLHQEMGKEGFKNKTEIYNALMHACVQGGEWRLAIQLLEDAKTYGPKADVISYNTGLNACVQMKDFKLATKLFDEMQHLGIQPDLYSFNTLMKALGDSNKPLGAESTFFDLQSRRGLWPDEISYNTLMKAYGDAGDWVSALDLYRQMRDYGDKVSPDIFTYNQLLHLLDYAGQVDSALEVAGDMTSSGVDVDAFTLTILAAAKSFDKSVVSRALGIKAEEFEFGYLYKAASALMRKRAQGHAVVSHPQILFNALISATKKDWEMANLVLMDMHNYRVLPDAVTFDALINVYVRAGQWSKARQMLQKMQAMDVEPNALTFSNVINACVAKGQWHRTLRELERSRDQYKFNFLAYNVLMAAYSNAGLLYDALDVYEKMTENAAPVNVVAYAAFLRACGRESRWEEAVDIMTDMRESSVRPNAYVQNQLVLGMVYDGALNNAMHVLQIMKQDCAPVSRETFRTVADQLRNLQQSIEDSEDSEEGEGKPTVYMQNMSRRLKSKELSPEQCDNMAQLLEDLCVDNPTQTPGEDDLEIWGGELDSDAETQAEVNNFVRFIKAGF